MMAWSRHLGLIALGLALLAGCDSPYSNPPAGSSPAAGRWEQVTTTGGQTLADARQGFTTRLTRRESLGEPAVEPPPELFELVRYPSPPGPLAAYVSRPPAGSGGNSKHPAIVWIFGGFSNSISETAWEPASPDNDQSARAFREADVVTMYPSLRGGNDNPGCMEGFYGEVDDVLAAAEFLAHQPHVDPQRIFLGGHSTGGTLALLVAAASDRFRAVFAFGPVDEVSGYGPDSLPFSLGNARELELRSPQRWIGSIRRPVFVLEGAGRPSNADVLPVLARAAEGNPNVHIHRVAGVDHFSILDPTTRLIAQKILADTGATCGIEFTTQELAALGR